MPQRFVALVTGASSGLVALLAGQGYHVLLAVRRLDKVTDLDAPLLMLLSDSAAYIALPVDGGRLVSNL